MSHLPLQAADPAAWSGTCDISNATSATDVGAHEYLISEIITDDDIPAG